MRRPFQAGITLVELLVVIAIVAALVGVAYPNITAGLADVRLVSAAGSAASFLTSAMNTVDRREQPASIVIDPKQNEIEVYTAASGEKPDHSMEMPDGIRIEGDDLRRFLLMPGGTVPRMTLVLRNGRGVERSVQIDPSTGVPKIQRVETETK